MASTDGTVTQAPQSSAPQQQVTTTTGQVGGQQVQVQQQSNPTPQQIQLQQATAAAGTIHGAQQHQAQQGGTMQQVQLIQTPQAQAYNIQSLQHLLNQGQLMIPGNFLNPNMNPQIQVITKPIQNQFTHMLQPGTTSYAIPTSGTNNPVSQYIIGNFSPTSPIQLQHQQGKPGEMTKVIGAAQLPQGLWASPQTLFTTGGQNSFLIRGAHPEQMYIQPQMAGQATSQQFSMQSIQTAATQLPTTSIAPVSTAQVQQTIQQGTIQQQTQQQQGQVSQQSHQMQPQQGMVTIKNPANLQPKPPPLQIQPNLNQQQTHTHQLQQQPQFQVTMTQQNPPQLHMIPPATTAATTMIPQSISISHQSQAQVIQQAQHQQISPIIPTQLQQTRQLTILPQGPQVQQQNIATNQSTVQIIQQPTTQAIRPGSGFTTGVTVVTTQSPNVHGINTNGIQLPQPRQKVRKNSIPRGTAGTTTILQPPRPGTQMINVPNPQQTKQFQTVQQTQQINTSLTRLPVITSQPAQQPQEIVQHLKTINISAIQPNLPDATITPLLPQQKSTLATSTGTTIQSNPSTIQVFTAAVPNPNISITPTAPPITQQQQVSAPRKDEVKESPAAEIKAENEKENAISKSLSVNGVVSHGEEADEMIGKQKLPKAMVKPQVLTHVLEGFVIQEASEPFPMPKNTDIDEPPKKKMYGEMAKCEMCGKVDLKSKFKKNKRFCSSHCAKGMKTAQQQAQTTSATMTHGTPLEEKPNKKGRGRKWGEGVDGNSTDETNSSVGEISATEEQAMEVDEGKVNPVKWGVAEVVDFVKNLPGCSEYADDFAVQEIDGQALLLLKEDHLMSAIGMKLGPALKLCAKIESIRNGSSGSTNSDGSLNSK